jgi:hypothetical protein
VTNRLLKNPQKLLKLTLNLDQSMQAGHLGAAPTFGADAMWVLEEVLGYDGERIAELAIAGALE